MEARRGRRRKRAHGGRSRPRSPWALGGAVHVAGGDPRRRLGGLAIGQRVTTRSPRSYRASTSSPISSSPRAASPRTTSPCTPSASAAPKCSAASAPAFPCGAAVQSAPGLAYVVFPGNVGAVDDLARVAAIMAAAATRAGAARRPSPSCSATRATPAAPSAFNVYNVEGALAVRRAVERAGLPPSCNCTGIDAIRGTR